VDTKEIQKKLRESLESLKARDATKEIAKAFDAYLPDMGCLISDRELATVDLDTLEKFIDKVIEIRLKYDLQYKEAATKLLGDDNE
jgi:hypothetical protein